MRLPITPITVNDVTCSEAVVSVAVSSSVAVRIVPVDADNVEYLDAATGIVGTADQPDIAAFIAVVSDATSALITARGI
jgi:hypothetical protein